ncbi:hypothetical protein AWQ21_07370 [Picosynechococcus sp. PCC 7003]|nr:hypothetical protein AWQ21_07370 [Picosynechococcus sp. PCC 7003]
MRNFSRNFQCCFIAPGHPSSEIESPDNPYPLKIGYFPMGQYQHSLQSQFCRLGLGLALFIGAFGFRPVLAQATQCKGSLGAIAIGDLEVPSGATCILRQTTVRGDIIVQPRGTLIANGAVIQGNIWAKQALSLNLNAATQVAGIIERPLPQRSLLQR